jgi:L-ascorbate metabolism protein UlaG (beta-lactamase superfamily)
MPVPADVEFALTFIGNATVLLRLGSFVLLTDPNFLHAGQRAYLGYGLWSKRLKGPAYAIGDLPPLDVVLLSHLHGDHWDRVAEAGLDETVPILTTGQAARTLQRRGFTTTGLAGWESFSLERDGARLTVTSLPGRHGPGLFAALHPDVMGSLIDFERGGERRIRIYLTGDTLYYGALRQVVERFPDAATRGGSGPLRRLHSLYQPASCVESQRYVPPARQAADRTGPHQCTRSDLRATLSDGQ